MALPKDVKLTLAAKAAELETTTAQAPTQPANLLHGLPPATNPNPPRGERGDFVPTTVTLPPDMLMRLQLLAVQRRSGGERAASVSGLVREAVAELLKRA